MKLSLGKIGGAVAAAVMAAEDLAVAVAVAVGVTAAARVVVEDIELHQRPNETLFVTIACFYRGGRLSAFQARVGEAHDAPVVTVDGLGLQGWNGAM